MMILDQFHPAPCPIRLPFDDGWSDADVLSDAALQGALVDGTLIATDDGWRPVETLRRGDRVLTLQNGFQTVRTVERQALAAEGGLPDGLRPLRIGPHVLGNVTPMALMPGQIVLSDDGSDDGGPRLVEASVMEASANAAPFQPGRELCLTRLCFDAPQLVCADYGAIVLCARAGDAGRSVGATRRAKPVLGRISEELVSNLFGNLEQAAAQTEAA